MTFDNVAGSWRNFDIQLVSFEEKQKNWQKKQISTYKVLIHLVSLSWQFLVGGIPTPLKNMSASVGMMKFPTEWTVIKFRFQTTNQSFFCILNIYIYLDRLWWFTKLHPVTPQFSVATRDSPVGVLSTRRSAAFTCVQMAEEVRMDDGRFGHLMINYWNVSVENCDLTKKTSGVTTLTTILSWFFKGYFTTTIHTYYILWYLDIFGIIWLCLKIGYSPKYCQFNREHGDTRISGVLLVLLYPHILRIWPDMAIPYCHCHCTTSHHIPSYFPMIGLIHRIGWWEKLQESPIFDGKNHGFL